jgi:hypothetical protein
MRILIIVGLTVTVVYLLVFALAAYVGRGDLS